MRKPWQKKEKKDLDLFKSKATPRSGGLWFAKGDSKSDEFLIENKTTYRENFTIVGKVWEKIKKEALLESRLPVLSVEFGTKKNEVVILDKNDFISLLEKSK